MKKGKYAWSTDETTLTSVAQCYATLEGDRERRALSRDATDGEKTASCQDKKISSRHEQRSEEVYDN